MGCENETKDAYVKEEEGKQQSLASKTILMLSLASIFPSKRSGLKERSRVMRSEDGVEEAMYSHAFQSKR
jgi:hypothetical protein